MIISLNDEDKHEDIESEHDSHDEYGTLSLKRKLEIGIQKNLVTQGNIYSEVNHDIDTIFENGGQRGKFLEVTYNRLLCILPTSVES